MLDKKLAQVHEIDQGGASLGMKLILWIEDC